MRTSTEVLGTGARLAFLLSPRSSNECRIDRRLYEEPRFRDVLRACDAVIGDQLGWSFESTLASERAGYHRALSEAEFEPAVTALQIALAELWRERGLRPEAVAGASGGEWGAAFVAGVLSLEDAMTVACSSGDVFGRGRATGSAVVAAMARAEAEAYMKAAPAPIYLAAQHSLGSVVFSGETDAIAAVSADLTLRKVWWRPAPTGRGVHSPLMDVDEPLFVGRLARLRPQAPRLAIYSAASGGRLEATAFDAAHWWRAFRQPAFFADAARRMLDDGYDTFVDLGLQPVLSGAVLEAAAEERRSVRILVSGGAPEVQTIDDELRELKARRPATPRPASPPAEAADFDPASADVRRDPYPHYHRLRSRAPVQHLPRAGYWAVLGHAEATAVLKDPAVYSSQILKPFDPTLIGADPPAHTRVRHVVTDAFAPARMAALETHIRARATRLLDGLAGRDAFDLVAEIAVPLPVGVIADLLGLGDAHLDRLKGWSHAVVTGASGRPGPEERARIGAASLEFRDFMVGHIARLQAEPDDSLLARLVGGRADGIQLSAAEGVSLARLLLIAGNETTTNLIGNAVLALLRNPAELDRVQRDLSLVPAAIEETLRYDAPVQAVDRITLRPAELGGASLPAQARVVVMIGAANRDAAAFPDPDTFSVARNPRAHLSFGAGPHACVGAFLSRLEARAVLEALLARRPALRAAQSLDDVERTESLHLRGPRRLMLEGAGG